ncbi:hypothetical protein BC830DRAFT_607535 [Chytriomyces sp. MP71]|nr:hypothetical protein BC830DRAFT_607535 [Chytriomyces sp. MP71]
MLGLDKRNRKTVLLSEVWNPKNLVRKTAKMSHLNATEASALASAKASLRSRFSYQAQKATPPSTSSKSSNLSLRDVVSSETVSAQERTGNPVPRSTPLSGAERDTIVCALGCTFGSEQCSKDTSWDPIIIDNVEYQSSAAVMFAEERNLCQDSFSTRMVDFACPEVLELDISFTDDCEASQCVPSASLSRELSSAHVSVQASPSGSFAIDMSKGALHEASPAFALPLRLDKNGGVTLVDYLRRHHHNDIKRCIFESQRAKDAMKGKYNNYQCLLNLDPLMLLDFDASLSLVRWDKSVTSAIFEACLALLNQTLQGGVILTSRPLQAEDLHLILRAAYLPAINELYMMYFSDVLANSTA